MKHWLFSAYVDNLVKSCGFWTILESNLEAV